LLTYAFGKRRSNENLIQGDHCLTMFIKWYIYPYTVLSLIMKGMMSVTFWITLFVSLLILLALAEEIIYFILRNKVIKDNQPAKEGKIKTFYEKVKLKLSPS
jgi:hypothetical protein